MSESDDTGPAYFKIEELPWPDEATEGNAPKELVEEAQRLGAKRKFLARGQGGYYSQYSVFPPGYTVPMHSHDHDEMIVILAGGCTMLAGDQQTGGPELTAHDSVVLHGGYEYGFTAGAEGLTFITIRNGLAETNLAK
jgi:quercetin dioxygenase-like cupin family protein